MRASNWPRWLTVGLVIALLGGSIAVAGASTPPGKKDKSNSIPPPPPADVVPPSDPNAMVMTVDAQGNVRTDAHGRPILVRNDSWGAGLPPPLPGQPGALQQRAPAGRTKVTYEQDENGNWQWVETVQLTEADLHRP